MLWSDCRAKFNGECLNGEEPENTGLNVDNTIKALKTLHVNVSLQGLQSAILLRGQQGQSAFNALSRVLSQAVSNNNKTQ